MTSRPFGVTLVAAFFALKAAALLLAAACAQLRPELRPSAYVYITGIAPISREFGASLAVKVAPFVAAIEAAFGLGLWFMKKWAWAYLVVIYGTGLVVVAGVLALSIFDRDMASLLPHSPYFTAGVLSEAVVVAYLLTPEVKRAFSESD